MKKLYFLIVILGVVCLWFLGGAGGALAYEIERMSDMPVYDDFTIGPGKIEAFLDAGDTTVRNLSITNRLGRAMYFNIELEDSMGSPSGSRSVILLGKERGPYSLKDYLYPEVMGFVLKHGERMILPVRISIPYGMEPGGLYGSVIISTSPVSVGLEREDDITKGQVQIIARLASLVFVRVKGDADESGFLESFDTVDSKNIYSKGPVRFSLRFRNTGNVHLNPYGKIEIKNILKKEIGEIEIQPYFAMPESLRSREVEWDRGLGLGRYTATISLNRGYQDIVDTMTVSFWILPWKIITIVGGLCLLLILLIWWIAVHLEVRRKPKKR